MLTAVGDMRLGELTRRVPALVKDVRGDHAIEVQVLTLRRPSRFCSRRTGCLALGEPDHQRPRFSKTLPCSRHDAKVAYVPWTAAAELMFTSSAAHPSALLQPRAADPYLGSFGEQAAGIIEQLDGTSSCSSSGYQLPYCTCSRRRSCRPQLGRRSAIRPQGCATVSFKDGPPEALPGRVPPYCTKAAPPSWVAHWQCTANDALGKPSSMLQTPGPDVQASA